MSDAEVMDDLTGKVVTLVLVAFLGVLSTICARIIWDRRTASRLRKALVRDLDSLHMVVVAAIKETNWQSQEAKVQGERVLNLYGSGDALEITRSTYVRNEIVEFLRSLRIFIDWFNCGGPYKSGDIFLEKPPESSIHIDDIARKTSTERFQFAQAHFDAVVSMVKPEDPLARRNMERAAHLLVVETNSFLGGGVGSNEVLEKIRVRLRDGLEKQSRMFYERLRVRTSSLLQLLGEA